MTSISATSSDPSSFSQGEGPASLPHHSEEELMDWFSSQINHFLSTTNAYAPVVDPTHTGSFADVELAHASDYGGNPEGINTSTTAIIVLCDRAIPIGITLSLVPLLHSSWAGQCPPSPGQGGEIDPSTPLHLSEPSQTLMIYSMADSDVATTDLDRRYSEYGSTASGFPIAPRNSIPQPEVWSDYQPSGHGDTILEPIPDCPPAAVTASPRVYPPPPYQVPGAPSGHFVSSHPSVSLESSALLTAPACQNDGNGLSTSRHVLQTYQNTPTVAGPMQGVEDDQHPSSYDYRSSRHSDTAQEPTPDCLPTAATASPGVAVYPGYLDSGHPSLSSPMNGRVVTPYPAHQNDRNGLSTTRQLVVQTHRDSPILSTTAGSIQGVVDQQPCRHQCRVCGAEYAETSALNRHYKDCHEAWIACKFCGQKFSTGRRYLLTKHMKTHHPDAHVTS